MKPKSLFRTHMIALIATALALFTSAQTALCFYNPSTGRWLNRDPLEEPGFSNLQREQPHALLAGYSDIVPDPNAYGLLRNNPNSGVEYLGAGILCFCVTTPAIPGSLVSASPTVAVKPPGGKPMIFSTCTSTNQGTAVQDELTGVICSRRLWVFWNCSCSPSCVVVRTWTCGMYKGRAHWLNAGQKITKDCRP